MAVDDEADITFTLKKGLEQSGFSLDVFNDPRRPLINFKPNCYDIILLDIVMPQMGTQFANAQSPIVAIPPNMHKCLSLVVSAYGISIGLNASFRQTGISNADYTV
jgi:DNA-binding NtrC family response regulator